MDRSKCQFDVHQVESWAMVIIINVLSVCTDAEDGWLEVNSGNRSNLCLHISL
jgi:hypothetical protein